MRPHPFSPSAARAAVLLLALAAGCARDTREPVDLLIANGTIITMDPARRVLDSASVAVQGDRIVAIGPAAALAARYAARETIDASRTIVMPGLIDSHGHAGHGLVKSLGMDTDEWYPATERIYAEGSGVGFWRTEALLTGIERVRFGTTTAVTFLGGGDMVMRTDATAYGDAYLAATDTVGIRMILGVGPRRPPFPKRYVDWSDGTARPRDVTFAQQLAVSESLVTRWHAKGDGRLRLAIAFPTHHPEQTPLRGAALDSLVAQARAARALSRRHGLLFVQDGHSTQSVRFAHEVFDVLGPDALLSHTTGMSDEEIAILARTGTKVVHNPSANAAMREPFRLVEMLDAGVTVVLGSDGVAPDRSYDMFRHVFQAMRYQRARLRDATVLPAGKALEMVTIDAARALGLGDEIGSLEVGKKADLILIDWARPHLAPRQMPLYRVAYFANGNDVRTTIVDGKVLMRDRRVLTVDEGRVLEEADREIALALQRTGLDSLTRTPAGFWGRSRLR